MTSPLLARRPTALGLARLSRYPLFPPGGEPLYRHLARLLELGPEHELLVVPSAAGVTARFLVETTGASGAGADPDAELVAAASRHAREAGLVGRLHFEEASLVDLPYQDEVFDVAIGEIGLAAAADPPAAVRELVRVTKPLGAVVLIQLVWSQQLEPEQRDELVERLGVRPYLQVEWKQMLRDASVVELHVDDWSDAVAPGRGERWPLGGLAEYPSLRDRIAVLFRAWQAWGWEGVRQFARFAGPAGDLLSGERVLGLSVIRGTKWQDRPSPEP